MNQILLIIIAILLFVLVAVFAYNMFQEKHYRNKIRNQFGHSDRDALLGSQVQSVRDGQSFSHEKVAENGRPNKLKPSLVGKKPTLKTETAVESINETDEDNRYLSEDISDDATSVMFEEPVTDSRAINTTVVAEPSELSSQHNMPVKSESGFVGELKATFARMLGGDSPPLVDQEMPMMEPVSTKAKEEVITQESKKRELLIPLNDLRQSRLPWFDERADYMAYVSLREPLELPALPRLSSRYRYQIVGCTMDGLFQPAEPIPGVMYQAFAIGLQAVSRNGLADARELEIFGRNIHDFSENMDGECYLDDSAVFLEQAQKLDDLCVRVDQTIAIHLVSRISILGIELRSTLEDEGLQLMDDGTFAYCDVGGDIKYTVVTLDGSRFTSSLLASQPYKGFSMLFDITRVPHGEKNFDEFMNLAVRLSSILNLELVDDQIQQLSTEWMKDVRSYVLGIQKEMLEADILPGSPLAQRLFA